ncbi:O-antigen ligase family protein [Elizabethkingia meningoseptica]|uniref:O-antigen ligase family protein n=1 Tax=Elizabethkingia meningoseptica TaxID=238 RepID=UPI0022F156EA|nr:O-antigen ligase family protein [Elizabethkingia meningoseptica]EJK5329678.1 O-antigen ligase family protein [Elizabethkingia meningoseptica]MDE5430889.1 O-antigen ligase family protein [Elizabethkingia meningoseptica]MDE5467967.1 O-antigen ligase family protein [Elizabethkingia meningoseptica]MDE5474886.1 O-antigen ligase family protein [Elizabethkingia meningoseptica]MDE5478319.1 O-antigen ligase family protein [Elizabethkingia meningoseptica]
METLPLHHQKFLKKLNNQMFIILLLMVACFFTWSENVAITRGIKVVGRMGVMISSILIYRKIINYGSVNSLVYKNIFSPILYIGYLTLGFISFSWSTNPGFSALQWFMTFQSFIFAYFFVKSLKILDIYFEGHKIRLYHLLGNTVFVLQLVFVIGMWVNPDVFFRLTDGGEEARLGGTMMNPNELGMLAGVGCACLIFDLYRFKNKIWTIVKILVIFYALFMTGSRSSLIGVLLIIFFHINQTKQRTLKFSIIAVVCAVAPFAVYSVILKGGDQERLEEVMSLTGRLPFWQALITEGLPREPLLGFGFMRIDYKEFFQSAHTYPGKMTHNTFMQVLMNLGFIGFTIVLFQVFFTVKSILSEQKELKLMLIGILIPIVINSFTEFGIFGESNYGIMFYQMIIFSVAFRNNNHLTRLQKIILHKKRPELSI